MLQGNCFIFSQNQSVNEVEKHIFFSVSTEFSCSDVWWVFPDFRTNMRMQNYSTVVNDNSMTHSSINHWLAYLQNGLEMPFFSSVAKRKRKKEKDKARSLCLVKPNHLKPNHLTLTHTYSLDTPQHSQSFMFHIHKHKEALEYPEEEKRKLRDSTFTSAFHSAFFNEIQALFGFSPQELP